ncbi:MAG: hypothetical protein WC332_01505 [Clostridia bacterium]|jgi:predicted DNA-binding protein
MKTCSKKKPFTIVLSIETYKALEKIAKKESRPVAQMARVIIERYTDPKLSQGQFGESK